MREPMPAAGTMPHMSRHVLHQLFRTSFRRVIRQRASPRALTDPGKLIGRDRHRIDRLLRRRGAQNFFADVEEVAETVPGVGEERRAAGGGFEESPRGTVAEL